jgi:long-subunit fatty acid transport protein
MLSHRSLALLIAATMLAPCGATRLQAQTNTENFSQFEFNFNSPGARATGIGGAFISIADDATAAEANPAGLTALLRPEVSFELKGVRFRRDVSNFSHTGTADNFTLVSREFENNLIIPSFGSVVIPMGNVVGSLFRHELVHFETSYFTKGSYVPPAPGTAPGDGSYFFPVHSDLTMKVVNWGAALSYKVSRGFSVGLSGGLSQLSVNSTLSRYYLEVFSTGNLTNESRIDDEGNSYFLNLGLLVRPADNLAIGAIYKLRPRFELEHNLLVREFPEDTVIAQTINFNVPSSIGLGISYRPLDVLTLAFDVSRVSYSDMTKDFVLVFGTDAVVPSDYSVDDAFEFHAGVEYVLLLRSMGVVFRGGLYNEADSRITFTGDPASPGDPDRAFVRRTQAALFQAGESDMHYTFGVGLLFGNAFQLDLAGNLSRGSDEVVGSFVVRF